MTQEKVSDAASDRYVAVYRLHAVPLVLSLDSFLYVLSQAGYVCVGAQ